MSICPKCGRERMHWPLYRRPLCSPAYWVYCIRPLEPAEPQGLAMDEALEIERLDLIAKRQQVAS